MLQRTAVTLLVLGVAPLTAQQDYMARARPMLGCWSIAVGAYAPKLTERGRDTAAVYPPRVMKVDTTAGQGLEATDGLGWLIAGVTPPIEQRWRGAVMLGRVDSVEINWFRTSGVLTAVVKPAPRHGARATHPHALRRRCVSVRPDHDDPDAVSLTQPPTPALRRTP
ncbi:MAG: hypothetical protein IPP98_07535 [Gemmatimonadetes bacterium]|nr:hypothetical protein [Gemmatimonadota bacterium]